MIKLILNGVNLRDSAKSDTIDFIPQIGSTIIYKTFRSNGDYGRPFIDYTLKVTDVIFETEEDYNGQFTGKNVNIIVTEISKIIIE